MGAHLIGGEFQSDKYPETPRGKVPLSCKDPGAQSLLWEYAQRRRLVDAEFSDDLEQALRIAGFEPPPDKAFDDALATLVAKELPTGRRNPARLALMIERLAHALGMTIAMGSGGDASVAGTLSDGAQNYLDETIAELMPLAAIMRGAARQ